MILPASVLGVFQLFFTATIMDCIVDQTSLYACQCMGFELYEELRKVTATELKRFMGFMILMGIVKLPSITDYWSRNAMFHYLPVASRISRTRLF